MNEIWKQVVGIEELYEVSNLGRVRTLTKNIRRLIDKDGRTLKQRLDGYGYFQVTLVSRGKTTSRKVHRLVLEACISACPPGKETCHRDGNKTNNSVENLYWGTRQQNEYDKCLISHQTVRLIFTSDGTRAAIARKYGVSPQTVRRIKNCERWAHITQAPD